MRRMRSGITSLLLVVLLFFSPCVFADSETSLLPEEFVKFAPVRLSADLKHLTEGDRQALKSMIEASKIMDRLFWWQSYGDPESLKTLIDDQEIWEYAKVNYGPWDRLQGNRPFVPGFGPKPLGANFYPTDMTKEEFEDAPLSDRAGLYSLIRRDSDGNLVSIPYSQAFRPELEAAALHLRKAAASVSDPDLKSYLELRAAAFLNDDYQPSDMAWMAMKDNPIDVVIGPIETYEDRLYGYRSAFEGYVLVKDLEWSERLARYAAFLPDLQEALPVADEYKAESPGTDSDLNAYDVIYYAGDCNAGSKTIAINLPNDEEVQLAMGSRRLQLKNAMRAKYDTILLPLSEILIHESQRSHITFDAFFANTMFHEVAHGLGIKKVVGSKVDLTVKDALKELSGGLEENKADLLGLFMIEELTRKGELPKEQLEDHHVTFLAGIFRSVRFGASSAHGVANLVRFNYFKEREAFTRDPNSGTYVVDFQKMTQANRDLSALVLTLQGDGDYEGAKNLLQQYGQIDKQLEEDLARLRDVPTDVVFEQGVEVLGL